LSMLCSFTLAVGTVSAQNAVRVEPAKGMFGWYKQRSVAPINLTNSSRLESLIRAGNLYLSAQDVIALTLENNLDIEIQRYGPILTKEVTRRTEGGGAIRSVGVGLAAGPTSVSLTGVSVNGSGGGTSASGVSSSGILTQLGPAIPNLDPQISLVGQFSHSTSPQSNTFLTGTTSLISDSRSYQAQISKYNDFGTYYQFTLSTSHLRFNSPFYTLNPFNSSDADFQITQNLLQGFGRPVLGRNIRVSKNNEKISNLQFKQQVITTVSAVLNLYWDLVSFNADLKARKDELATARALFEDNQKQVKIGTLAPIEVTRAEAQVYSSEQDLLISQTNLLQQETVLKNALSRNGVATPTLADVHVVPLDTVQVPPQEEIQAIDQLVQEALVKRIEIAQDKINIDSQQINLRAIRNGLRPSLQLFAELTNNGLAGSANYLAPGTVAPNFLVGGTGTSFEQILHRNYPNYSAGVSLNIPLRNRAAQSDYVTSALEERQAELSLQKAVNQVRVDVQNAMIGLRQARVRYDSAVKARILQQQTLDADRKKYTLGASTVFQVVQDQQNLAAAQSTEQQSLANYSHARISFDQAMGTTLEVNHVSIDEAMSGKVMRPSDLPATLPAAVETQEQKQ
jgi:outer membrane protein